MRTIDRPPARVPCTCGSADLTYAVHLTKGAAVLCRVCGKTGPRAPMAQRGFSTRAEKKANELWNMMIEEGKNETGKTVIF